MNGSIGNFRSQSNLDNISIGTRSSQKKSVEICVKKIQDPRLNSESGRTSILVKENSSSSASTNRRQKSILDLGLSSHKFPQIFFANFWYQLIYYQNYSAI